MLKVERLLINRIVTTFCNPENEQSFISKGFYDFSGAPDSIRPPDPSLLENNMFAAGIERQFARIMGNTLHAGRIPSASEAASLGLFVLTLFFRSPAFHEIMERYVSKVFREDPQLPALQHVATLTSAYSIMSATTTKNCVFHLAEAGGKKRFWTCDVPSWHWSQENNLLSPVEDVEELQSAADRGAYLRWICPLSPRFVMEVAPRPDGGEEVQHRMIQDSEVSNLNHIVLSRARRVRVVPME
jgi:hypothetical protein